MSSDRTINPPDWSAARNVLLIRLRSIGDTVLMTPCLTALKSLHPDIRISVVSEPLAAPLLEDHPLVDNLIVVERSAGARARLIRRLRRERYDAAFNLHGGTTSMWLMRLAGAKQLIGYKGYRHSQWLDLQAPNPDVLLGRKQLHCVEQQLALLHWAGVPWPATRPQLQLAVSTAAENGLRDKLTAACAAQADRFRTSQAGRLPDLDEIARGRFAMVAPAAAFESKRWTGEGFAQVVHHLRDRWALPSVVIAGPGQESLADRIASQAGAVPLVNLTLKELMALIHLSRLFVGNDSGPMHIAAAFGRPLVAVFGSSNPTVWHPWTDSPYQLIGDQEGSGGREQSGGRGPGAGGRTEGAPWPKDTNDPDADGSFAIQRITTDEVIAAVDKVLEPALAAG